MSWEWDDGIEKEHILECGEAYYSIGYSVCCRSGTMPSSELGDRQYKEEWMTEHKGPVTLLMDLDFMLEAGISSWKF